MSPVDDVILDGKVLVDNIGPVDTIGVNRPNSGGSHKDVFRLFSLKKVENGTLLEKIESCRARVIKRV